MSDEFNEALAAEVQRRIQAKQWSVVAIGGGPAIPHDVKNWVRSEFEVEDPILVVLEAVSEVVTAK